jgi:hypothetical protein
MLANAVFSSANIPPLNGLRESAGDCGQLVLTFESMRVGRAWWFLAKFMLVLLEGFILAW